MIRTFKTLLFLITMLSFLLSCSAENNEIFFGDKGSRNKILVISDIHLGADPSYTECLDHAPRLIQFLKEVRKSSDIKELVIAGDLVDEWYVPARVNTYGGGTQKDFIKKIAANNQEIFECFNGIIKDKKIKVTYIPGNHDLGITPESIEELMPGVNQARYPGKPGIGTYYPDGYPEIAIEHAHRFDFFCSLDPYSNQDEAPGTVMPVGYFYSRIAVNSVTNYPSNPADIVHPRLAVNNFPGDQEQDALEIYAKMWYYILNYQIPIKDNHDEKMIVTNIEKFTKNYSVNDVVPYNNPETGRIETKLYNGFTKQSVWDKRSDYNLMYAKTEVKSAINGSNDNNYVDDHAQRNFFNNPNSPVRIVVFGHTHEAKIKTYNNIAGKECVYANSGTWVDAYKKAGKALPDQDVKFMDFVLIQPDETNPKKVKVELYNYRRGKHNIVDSKEIEL